MSRREKKDAAMAWLERTNPLTGMTIRDLQNVFDCARNGDTQRLHWIFNEIESVNPVLLVCVERRASAVANFQWRVAERASQDGQLSAEQKDAVETFLGDIENLTEAFEHLDLAFFRGFAHCQPIWKADGTVREISLLDSWKFVRQGGEWFFNPECTGFSSDMQSCANARLMTVTRRRPIDYPALGIHVRDAVGNRDWGRFLERHALPKPAVTMHQGATEEQRRDYLEAAECVENGQVSVWPFGSSLTDFAGGSRGVDPFKNFIEHQERRIVLLATGGTLMSLAESGTGTLAGNAQTDVWESIVARDSAVIAQAVTRSLVRPYLEHAFPGKTCAVEFGFDFTKQPTPKEVAEVAATLKTAGWRVDQGELEEATGFTLEKEEAENSSMPGGFGPFANKAPAASLQTALPPFKTASSKPDGQGEGQEPGALLEPFLRALQGDCKMIAGEVEELLKDPTPEKARALLDKIPDLVPEDPALAPLLAEEMAKAYGEAFTNAQPIATNKEDQARGESGPGTNSGSFVKDGGSSGAPSETTEKTPAKPNPQNDGKIDFRGNTRAKAKADTQAQNLGYAGIDDLMQQSAGVSAERITEVVAGSDQPCKPHEAIAALRSHATIQPNVSGELPVKLTESPIRHYVCGERRHHNGEPDVSRLASLPSAIKTIRESDSHHHEFLEERVLRMPGEKMPKGTQTIYERNAGRSKAFAYTDSGVLNGWQLN